MRGEAGEDSLVKGEKTTVWTKEREENFYAGNE